MQKSYALILGASSGFGAATARELARRGYHIIGLHLDRAAAQGQIDELRSDIESHGVSSIFFNVNAADQEKRNEVIEELVRTVKTADVSGPVSILLHSLAFGTLRPLVGNESTVGVTQAQLTMTLDVMANSLVYWVQDLVKAELLAENGRIFALTSSGSRSVLPHYGPVSAAKAALESYCRQLAFELGSRSISVNAIEAGVTDTPALRKIPGSDVIISHATSRNPRTRLGRPEDVARVIASLCTDDAGWINGATIRVDGGESIVELDWRESN